MADDEQELDSARDRPSVDEIKAELARILDSAAFRGAGRAKEFLSFVVEEALAGRADRLKGYVIGVAVFGRPTTFDAQTDPVVRVEAGRLRRRLIEYYAEEGGANPLRIDLPRGSYAPSFTFERPEPDAPAHRPVWHSRKVIAGAATIILAVAVAVAAAVLWRLEHREPGRSTVPASAAEAAASGPRTGPRMLVLPITNLSDDPTLGAFARGLTDELLQGLVGFNIFSTASPQTEALASTELDKLREEFDVDYVLVGSLRQGDRTLRLVIRLVDAATGTQLWTRTFNETLDGADPVTIQERTGLLLAELLSSPLGPVYAHEISLAAAKPATELDPYECLLRFYDYARSFDRALHAEAVLCTRRAVLSEPNFAPAWAALAVLYLHEWTFGYGPQPDRGPALERALDAARRALDMAPSDRVATMAAAGAMLAGGNRTGFDQAAERALAAKPLHPAVAAQFGYLYVTAGDWQHGTELLDQAARAMTELPASMHAAYAFADLQRHDYARALTSALAIDSPDWFVAPMTMAATAALAGRSDIAEREAARLLRLYPDFERTGREQLLKWNISGELRTTLLDGLRLAGLSIA